MVSKKVVLKFPSLLVDQPIVCNLVRKHNLEFNILKAQVSQSEEGLMVLELKGRPGNYRSGLRYLRGLGVKIQPLSRDVTRNDAKCTHCGACVTICPTGALYVEPGTRKVIFLGEKCIACEVCIKACPPRAMEVSF